MALCALVPPPALASGVGVPVTPLDPISSLLSLPKQLVTALCVRQQALTQPGWELRTVAWQCSPYGFRENKPHLLSGIPSSLSLVSKCPSQARCYGYPRALAAQASQKLCGSEDQREEEAAMADEATPCLPN